ncbi:nucleotide sugar dehydrogenase [Mycolicibacterium vanbaalenii]|uniref:UDP-glucose/GDP-mannose dehydrogenase n=1 Tax=Mycolicibacterium vanbaalenii (strain DSM 7251 / JCM 13017 / BCRC 16820 / KCTC 9966 / NRRL B-24157 / PYR-1) TaxID=350058 RepID=A1T2M5_MYCVP|nr:nucleotide sugar dehydrogenase [Mycolicibacterium vanbaalenii]ABM11425.1 UDP-glucose/GDP-mannose dehydrogenase [Mycolicibacterium vanbaalenii PYR-1]
MRTGRASREHATALTPLHGTSPLPQRSSLYSGPRPTNPKSHSDWTTKRVPLTGLTRSGYEFDIPNLQVLSDPVEADVFVLCVDSPVGTTTRKADLSNLKAASESVGRYLRSTNLVIVRSTVPVGTTRGVVARLLSESSGLVEGDFSLAFAPERTSTGMTLRESSQIPHLVGGRDSLSAERAAEFLQSAGMRSLVMESAEAAELGKLASNAARDTALALAAQICAVAELHNLDVERLVNDVNHDYPRDHIKMPRPGVGGSCLTKDSYILAESLASTPLGDTLFGLVRRINDETQAPTIRSLARHFTDHFRREFAPRILVCGAAFKGDPPTRDTRNAVSLVVARELMAQEYSVAVFDPFISGEEISELGFEPASIAEMNAPWNGLLLYSNHKFFSDENVVRKLVQNVCGNGFIYDPYRWCKPTMDAIRPGTLYRTLSTEKILP